jgi:hypothetical protein
VKSSLEGLISGPQESKEEAEMILDSKNLLEAQQLLLHHQVETSLFTTCSVWTRDEE